MRSNACVYLFKADLVPQLILRHRDNEGFIIFASADLDLRAIIVSIDNDLVRSRIVEAQKYDYNNDCV